MTQLGVGERSSHGKASINMAVCRKTRWGTDLDRISAHFMARKAVRDRDLKEKTKGGAAYVSSLRGLLSKSLLVAIVC
jgi:hypothetical protein